MARASLPRIRESLLQQLPVLSSDQREVARSLYLLLFQGRPVAASQVAVLLGRPKSQVETSLAALGELERNPDGAVTAFRGLTIQPTQHAIVRMAEPEVVLYGWCAFDTLFLADLLAQPVRIHSSCPQSGASLSLDINVDSANQVSNKELRVSFPCLDGCSYQKDLRSSFCCHVQFYRDKKAVEAWQAGHGEPIEFLSVKDALNLAQDRNRTLLGVGGEPFVAPMDQGKVTEGKSIR